MRFQFKMSEHNFGAITSDNNVCDDIQARILSNNQELTKQKR